MRLDRAGEGFTLIEMVVTLAIIGILATILFPLVNNYIDGGRLARAQSDVTAIGNAIGRFERDLGRYPMFTTASGGIADSNANVVLLYGPNTNSYALLSESSGGHSLWTSPGVSDTFDDQFVANTPGYATSNNPAKQFVWKGPYISVDSDPWGHPYLVNIIEAKSGSGMAGFVLSAGPDGIIQTGFAQTTSSFSALGDDIVYRFK